MKSLKQILQYNKLFAFTLIILILYIFLFTKVIKYKSNYNIKDTILSGNITSISINGNKLTLEIKGKEKVIANYYIKTLDEKNNILNILHHGDKILLEGTFKVPSNNTIPNNFNYKKYLYNKKIYYTFDISNYKVIKENSNLLYKIKDLIYKRAYNMNNNDYYLSLILGDKSLLSSEIYNNFQINGTSHLLALSGMHLNVLLLAINIFLKNIKESIRIITTGFILIIFLLLTGITASLERAVIFYILKNINKCFNLRYSNIQILFICAFIILFLNPFMIYDIGFIYSFLICFGIFYYNGFIKGNYFIKLFKLSLITFLFSFPISIFINYEVNLSSVFINMVFVPLVSLIVYPVSLISFIFPFLNPIFNILTTLTNTLSSIFTKLSIIINIPKVSILFVFLLYIFILLFKYNKRCIMYLLITIIIIKLMPRLDSNFYVYYLDVGQGDSAILIYPYKSKVVMLDTGGKLDYSEYEWMISSKKHNISDNVIKFLKSKGITKLDYLILTHGDSDHMKESINLVNNYKVDMVIFNCGPYNNLEKELIKVLEKKNIKYHSCIKELNVDNNKLYFLQTKEYDNENDNSNVIYTKMNGYKFMFMADAGTEKEKDILNEYDISDIDVLKVGHHGSKTSSSRTFIDEINPKYSIISVGKNNRYGHPNKEVLNTLENSKIYRTDQDGSIMFKIRNNKLKIETCNP